MRLIYTSKEHILTISDVSQPSLHKHFYKHIAISFGKPLQFTIDKEKIRTAGIAINSNVLHTLECEGQKHIIILLEGDCEISRAVDDRFLQGKAYGLISQDIVDQIKKEKLFCQPIKEAKQYDVVFHHLTEVLGLNHYMYLKCDPRIEEVVSYLKSKAGIDSETLSELLEVSHLSSSRLSHLFKAEMGISLSSYLALIKTYKAYSYLAKGDNVTEAALNAGFSSSNHFANASKSLFGFSASSLNKESVYFDFT